LVAGHLKVSEKGRQRSVGRGNAKRFPLQGPHGGMGAARTDGEHAVTGPHCYNSMIITEFRMFTKINKHVDKAKKTVVELIIGL
jgi:hypothetical protein